MTEPHSTQRLRLYLMRHGEVEGAGGGRLFGQTDVGLSASGVEQSGWLAEMLAATQLRAVYSSDLQRASIAAEMIAAKHGLDVQRDAAWREINMGEWEGRSMSELYEVSTERVQELFSDPASFTYPAGESFATFTVRIRQALDRILSLRNVGEIALVAHGGVCRTIIGDVLGMPAGNLLRLSQDYGALNIVDWYGCNPMLIKLNHNGHSGIDLRKADDTEGT